MKVWGKVLVAISWTVIICSFFFAVRDVYVASKRYSSYKIREDSYQSCQTKIKWLRKSWRRQLNDKNLQ